MSLNLLNTLLFCLHIYIVLEILLGCLILVFKHTVYNNKFDVRLIVSVFGGCVFEARGLNQSHGSPAINMTSF